MVLGSEIEAMRQLALAQEKRSLHAFQQMKQQFSKGLAVPSDLPL